MGEAYVFLGDTEASKGVAVVVGEGIAGEVKSTTLDEVAVVVIENGPEEIGRHFTEKGFSLGSGEKKSNDEALTFISRPRKCIVLKARRKEWVSYVAVHDRLAGTGSTSKKLSGIVSPQSFLIRPRHSPPIETFILNWKIKPLRLHTQWIGLKLWQAGQPKSASLEMWCQFEGCQ